MYSAIAHLAKLSGCRLQLKNAIGMFSAYFDESGTKRDLYAFTVGGGVSSVKKWALFESEWKAILSSHGLSQLHMKDIYVNRREFTGWETRADERAVLLCELSACIKKRVNKTKSVSILLKDWNVANSTYRLREEIGNPYPFCALGCVALVREWGRRNAESKPVEYFFEDGAENKGELSSLCNNEYGFEPIFLPKGKVPFEMADLIAWV